MIWGAIVGKHGGNEKLALKSIDRGDVIPFPNPKDPSKMLYRMDKVVITNSAFNEHQKRMQGVGEQEGLAQ